MYIYIYIHTYMHIYIYIYIYVYIYIFLAPSIDVCSSNPCHSNTVCQQSNNTYFRCVSPSHLVGNKITGEMVRLQTR